MYRPRASWADIREPIKSQWVLQFNRCASGYQYQRTLVSSNRKFSSPQGIVCAHESVYLVSVDRGTITRLSLSGEVLEETAPYEDAMGGGFYVLWGMCLGPDGRTLFVAANVSEDGEYRLPTRTNTGCILSQELNKDGSFRGTTQKCVSNHKGPGLNRPSDPAFCIHGCLLVSSFVSPTNGTRRRVYKFGYTTGETLASFRNFRHERDGVTMECQGWLGAESGDSDLFSAPWGISCTPGGEVCVTSHNLDSAVSLVKLESCGCMK
eukprot:CAMPEP_0185760814 /NCGR_PEP_ID=MMETSP1174-20130828/19737_1 /TAXON_ID=35687 /ORGANISM="Dictyocha speculum, Strain CCMP1381" /LENGTH=264 /DNA_ID=CAMNT_0028441789 /DNA_START=438 /DNA_END=1229 /DNA_ORIENTATION=+